MNDRIKKLLSQANIYDGRESLYWCEGKNLVEFAELIINDCTDIINKRKDAAIEASWNVDEAMSNAVWDIEAHFYGD